MPKDDYTSILDKTDWKKTIQKALEEAVLSIGQGEIFFYNVEQAIAAIKAVYPNWDADTEIEEGIKKIQKKHNDNAQAWIDTHRREWAYIWTKALKVLDWQTDLYMELLQFIKNMAGKHRMLLWGIKRVDGGTALKDKDVDVESD